MDRDTFSCEILKRIKECELKEINEEVIKKTEKLSKNGIYFIYGEDKENVIYVGKVGCGNDTSVAHRFYLHYDGAHIKKEWFQKYAKFYRFCAFPNATKEEIELIERLMIYTNNQPIFNDKDTSEEGNDFESLLKRL
ncbi:hypothetical protein [uncultured Ruminococcus sp.]|uniref:hypothetical protein n=1 Tax=uncultured Ruminococcus sp. TaxID=165186 RepID=UPI002615211A|nr:hypothetical protein [uncultured Ruminococcus sp.]